MVFGDTLYDRPNSRTDCPSASCWGGVSFVFMTHPDTPAFDSLTAFRSPSLDEFSLEPFQPLKNASASMPVLMMFNITGTPNEPVGTVFAVGGAIRRR